MKKLDILIIVFLMIGSFAVGVYASPITQLGLEDFPSLQSLMDYCGVSASNIMEGINCLKGGALNPTVLILDRDIEVPIYDSQDQLTGYYAKFKAGSKLIGYSHIVK